MTDETTDKGRPVPTPTPAPPKHGADNTPEAAKAAERVDEQPKAEAPKPDMSPEKLPARVDELRKVVDEKRAGFNPSTTTDAERNMLNGLIWALWCMEGGAKSPQKEPLYV